MEKMSNLVDFALTYGKEPNWEKVEKVYGKEKVEEIKRWREVFSTI